MISSLAPGSAYQLLLTPAFACAAYCFTQSQCSSSGVSVLCLEAASRQMPRLLASSSGILEAADFERKKG